MTTDEGTTETSSDAPVRTPTGSARHRTARVSVDVLAEPERIWTALVRPMSLATWLGRVVEGNPGPGPGFALEHSGGQRSRHTVRRWERPRRLALTWDFPDEARSSVGFDLEVLPEGTRITVVHEDLDDPASYAAGWHRHLQYLAAHVDGDALPWEEFWDGYDELRAAYAADA